MAKQKILAIGIFAPPVQPSATNVGADKDSDKRQACGQVNALLEAGRPVCDRAPVR